VQVFELEQVSVVVGEEVVEFVEVVDVVEVVVVELGAQVVLVVLAILLHLVVEEGLQLQEIHQDTGQEILQDTVQEILQDIVRLPFQDVVHLPFLGIGPMPPLRQVDTAHQCHRSKATGRMTDTKSKLQMAFDREGLLLVLEIRALCWLEIDPC